MSFQGYNPSHPWILLRDIREDAVKIDNGSSNMSKPADRWKKQPDSSQQLSRIE